MQANPYAPPKAELADTLQDGTSPHLWNPGAAANWSQARFFEKDYTETEILVAGGR